MQKGIVGDYVSSVHRYHQISQISDVKPDVHVRTSVGSDDRATLISSGTGTLLRHLLFRLQQYQAISQSETTLQLHLGLLMIL
jgi:hypothetical protein